MGSEVPSVREWHTGSFCKGEISAKRFVLRELSLVEIKKQHILQTMAFPDPVRNHLLDELYANSRSAYCA